MSETSIILVAEDREDDILLIKQALAKANVSRPLYFVCDGEEAIAYLQGIGKFSNRDEHPLPDLLLLDLKMPRIDGFEVLKWIRQQPGLSTMRVVVLTSSTDMKDVNLAYQLGANSFLVKPLDFECFAELGKFINEYWLRLDKGPRTSRAAPPQVAKQK